MHGQGMQSTRAQHTWLSTGSARLQAAGVAQRLDLMHLSVVCSASLCCIGGHACSKCGLQQWINIDLFALGHC